MIPSLLSHTCLGWPVGQNMSISHNVTAVYPIILGKGQHFSAYGVQLRSSERGKEVIILGETKGNRNAAVGGRIWSFWSRWIAGSKPQFGEQITVIKVLLLTVSKYGMRSAQQTFWAMVLTINQHCELWDFKNLLFRVRAFRLGSLWTVLERRWRRECLDPERRSCNRKNVV